jgi:pilus assembly protein Flp/PilA
MTSAFGGRCRIPNEIIPEWRAASFRNYRRLAPESAPCIIPAGLDQKGRAMKLWFENFFKDEHGATAIEYGLIAAGIAVAIIAVVQGVGSGLNTTLTSVSTALK